MKKISFLTVLAVVFGIVLSGQVQAQACYGGSIPANELGIRLTSLTDASNVGGISIADRSAHVGVLNGLHYKRYGEFGAFRAMLGITRYEVEDRRNCPECLVIDGNVTEFKLRAGYEWFAILGQIEPYAGIDAVFAFGNYKGESWTISVDEYREYTDNRERRGIGVAPVAGLRLYLGYAISVSAETTVEAMFYGRTSRIAQVSPESSVMFARSNYFETTFQPLNSLSLNVLF